MVALWFKNAPWDTSYCRTQKTWKWSHKAKQEANNSEVNMYHIWKEPGSGLLWILSPCYLWRWFQKSPRKGRKISDFQNIFLKKHSFKKFRFILCIWMYTCMPCGYWELNSTPLEELPILLTTESSFSSQKYYLLRHHNYNIICVLWKTNNYFTGSQCADRSLWLSHKYLSGKISTKIQTSLT